MNSTRHSWHLVNMSPWPLLTALNLGGTMINIAAWSHQYSKAITELNPGIWTLLAVIISWLRDIYRESIYEGTMNTRTISNQRLGILLFIISEAMIFAAIFWALLDSASQPKTALGCIWPPTSIEAINPLELPLLNTLLLLNSGAWVTRAHHELINQNNNQAILGTALTILLATTFSIIQWHEYAEASFNIDESTYGATFYTLTGLHGLHVIAGTLYLGTAMTRINLNSFTRERHIQIESAVWYWHFVDIIWILLWVGLYLWGTG
nr:cytochrome c oxidase subunit III [Rhodosorus marinus]